MKEFIDKASAKPGTYPYLKELSGLTFCGEKAINFLSTYSICVLKPGHIGPHEAWSSKKLNQRWYTNSDNIESVY